MDTEIEQIEMSIQQAKEAKDMMEAVMRLSDNKDFKKVIHDDYFEKYAARLVLLKSDPSMQDERQQRDVDNSIIAVGYFRQYLSSLIQLGRQAEREILDAEQAKEEIMAEV